MRILHTEWSDGWGGQERRVLSEMTGLAGRGHFVALATRPQCRIRALAEMAGLPVLQLPLRSPLDFGSMVSLRRFLRQQNIDIVNTHSGVDSWVGGVTAKWAGTPILLRTRHLNLALKRGWLNFIHHLPDRIITCGEAIRTQLMTHSRFPAEQLVSIPTGIDLENFRPRTDRRTVRKNLGAAETDFVILMVGILRSVKGHDTALKAFQKACAKIPHARLILAGDGPLLQAMEELARDLGVSERVGFLGFREDVADLMGAADVLLLTSRSEGVPQCVTQAMSVELPVVATRVGGVVELIAHEETGLLVPPEDPEAAADAIVRVHHERDLARRWAARGRTLVEAKYSLKTMLDRTEELCAGLLSKKKLC
ncbi:MAG: glycosyltransferase family 4 protein [Verrucomicrobia bacterium]|nr:glycosyltransferase family 4 protein [Verrucomicrobiota bacterium]